jgi:hypothetical protein
MSQTTEQLKQLTVNFFQEVLGNQNFSLIPQTLADGYTFNGAAQTPDQLQGWIEGMHSNYPGMNFLIETILAEDETVALRWRLVIPPCPAAPAGGHYIGTNIIVWAGGKAISNDQNDLLGQNVLVSASSTPAQA